MFKLESYVAPLILNYLNEWVELRRDDLSLSLWGGAATLTNLNIRLEAVQRRILRDLPLELVSGKLRQLKVSVPWTKLGSQPVVLTIDTIEMVVRLKGADGKSTDDAAADGSPSSGEDDDADDDDDEKHVKRRRRKLQKQQRDTASPVKSGAAKPTDDATAVSEKAPPQSFVAQLISKVLTNVEIRVNNLTISLADDTARLSFNFKSIHFHSATSDELSAAEPSSGVDGDKNGSIGQDHSTKSAFLSSLLLKDHWSHGFAEPPSAYNPFLKKCLTMTSFTICLDAVGATGRQPNNPSKEAATPVPSSMRSPSESVASSKRPTLPHHYQDPVLYSCDAMVRVLFVYDRLAVGSGAVDTIVSARFDNPKLSLSDTQLPLMLGLVRKVYGVYYDMALSRVLMQELSRKEDSNPVNAHSKSDLNEKGKKEVEVITPGGENESWSSWAWGYVPAIFGDEEDEEGDEHSIDSRRSSSNGTNMKNSPSTNELVAKRRRNGAFLLTMECSTIRLTLKLTQLSHMQTARVTFRPTIEMLTSQASKQPAALCLTLVGGRDKFYCQIRMSKQCRLLTIEPCPCYKVQDPARPVMSFDEPTNNRKSADDEPNRPDFLSLFTPIQQMLEVDYPLHTSDTTSTVTQVVDSGTTSVCDVVDAEVTSLNTASLDSQPPLATGQAIEPRLTALCGDDHYDWVFGNVAAEALKKHAVQDTLKDYDRAHSDYDNRAFVYDYVWFSGSGETANNTEERSRQRLVIDAPTVHMSPGFMHRCTQYLKELINHRHDGGKSTAGDVSMERNTSKPRHVEAKAFVAEPLINSWQSLSEERSMAVREFTLSVRSLCIVVYPNDHYSALGLLERDVPEASVYGQSCLLLRCVKADVVTTKPMYPSKLRAAFSLVHDSLLSHSRDIGQMHFPGNKQIGDVMARPSLKMLKRLLNDRTNHLSAKVNATSSGISLVMFHRELNTYVPIVSLPTLGCSVTSAFVGSIKRGMFASLRSIIAAKRPVSEVKVTIDDVAHVAWSPSIIEALCTFVATWTMPTTVQLSPADLVGKIDRLVCVASQSQQPPTFLCLGGLVAKLSHSRYAEAMLFDMRAKMIQFLSTHADGTALPIVTVTPWQRATVPEKHARISRTGGEVLLIKLQWTGVQHHNNVFSQIAVLPRLENLRFVSVLTGPITINCAALMKSLITSPCLVVPTANDNVEISSTKSEDGFDATSIGSQSSCLSNLPDDITHESSVRSASANAITPGLKALVERVIVGIDFNGILFRMPQNGQDFGIDRITLTSRRFSYNTAVLSDFFCMKRSRSELPLRGCIVGTIGDEKNVNLLRGIILPNKSCHLIAMPQNRILILREQHLVNMTSWLCMLLNNFKVQHKNILQFLNGSTLIPTGYRDYSMSMHSEKATSDMQWSDLCCLDRHSIKCHNFYVSFCRDDEEEVVSLSLQRLVYTSNIAMLTPLSKFSLNELRFSSQDVDLFRISSITMDPRQAKLEAPAFYSEQVSSSELSSACVIRNISMDLKREVVQSLLIFSEEVLNSLSGIASEMATARSTTAASHPKRLRKGNSLGNAYLSALFARGILLRGVRIDVEGLIVFHLEAFDATLTPRDKCAMAGEFFSHVALSTSPSTRLTSIDVLSSRWYLAQATAGGAARVFPGCDVFATRPLRVRVWPDAAVLTTPDGESTGFSGWAIRTVDALSVNLGDVNTTWLAVALRGLLQWQTVIGKCFGRKRRADSIRPERVVSQQQFSPLSVHVFVDNVSASVSSGMESIQRIVVCLGGFQLVLSCDGDADCRDESFLCKEQPSFGDIGDATLLNTSNQSNISKSNRNLVVLLNQASVSIVDSDRVVFLLTINDVSVKGRVGDVSMLVSIDHISSSLNCFKSLCAIINSFGAVLQSSRSNATLDVAKSTTKDFSASIVDTVASQLISLPNVVVQVTNGTFDFRCLMEEISHKLAVTATSMTMTKSNMAAVDSGALSKLAIAAIRIDITNESIGSKVVVCPVFSVELNAAASQFECRHSCLQAALSLPLPVELRMSKLVLDWAKEVAREVAQSTKAEKAALDSVFSTPETAAAAISARRTSVTTVPKQPTRTVSGTLHFNDVRRDDLEYQYVETTTATPSDAYPLPLKSGVLLLTNDSLLWRYDSPRFLVSLRIAPLPAHKRGMDVAPQKIGLDRYDLLTGRFEPMAHVVVPSDYSEADPPLTYAQHIGISIPKARFEPLTIALDKSTIAQMSSSTIYRLRLISVGIDDITLINTNMLATICDVTLLECDAALESYRFGAKVANLSIGYHIADTDSGNPFDCFTYTPQPHIDELLRVTPIVALTLQDGEIDVRRANVMMKSNAICVNVLRRNDFSTINMVEMAKASFAYDSRQFGSTATVSSKETLVKVTLDGVLAVLQTANDISRRQPMDVQHRYGIRPNVVVCNACGVGQRLRVFNDHLHECNSSVAFGECKKVRLVPGAKKQKFMVQIDDAKTDSSEGKTSATVMKVLVDVRRQIDDLERLVDPVTGFTPLDRNPDVPHHDVLSVLEQGSITRLMHRACIAPCDINVTFLEAFLVVNQLCRAVTITTSDDMKADVGAMTWCSLGAFAKSSKLNQSWFTVRLDNGSDQTVLFDLPTEPNVTVLSREWLSFPLSEKEVFTVGCTVLGQTVCAPGTKMKLHCVLALLTPPLLFVNRRMRDAATMTSLELHSARQSSVLTVERVLPFYDVRPSELLHFGHAQTKMLTVSLAGAGAELRPIAASSHEATRTFSNKTLPTVMFDAMKRFREMSITGEHNGEVFDGVNDEPARVAKSVLTLSMAACQVYETEGSRLECFIVKINSGLLLRNRFSDDVQVELCQKGVNNSASILIPPHESETSVIELSELFRTDAPFQLKIYRQAVMISDEIRLDILTDKLKRCSKKLSRYEALVACASEGGERCLIIVGMERTSTECFLFYCRDVVSVSFESALPSHGVTVRLIHESAVVGQCKLLSGKTDAHITVKSAELNTTVLQVLDSSHSGVLDFGHELELPFSTGANSASIQRLSFCVGQDYVIGAVVTWNGVKIKSEACTEAEEEGKEGEEDVSSMVPAGLTIKLFMEELIPSVRFVNMTSAAVYVEEWTRDCTQSLHVVAVSNGTSCLWTSANLNRQLTEESVNGTPSAQYQPVFLRFGMVVTPADTDSTTPAGVELGFDQLAEVTWSIARPIDHLTPAFVAGVPSTNGADLRVNVSTACRLVGCPRHLTVAMQPMWRAVSPSHSLAANAGYPLEQSQSRWANRRRSALPGLGKSKANTVLKLKPPERLTSVNISPMSVSFNQSLSSVSEFRKSRSSVTDDDNNNNVGDGDSDKNAFIVDIDLRLPIVQISVRLSELSHDAVIPLMVTLSTVRLLARPDGEWKASLGNVQADCPVAKRLGLSFPVVMKTDKSADCTEPMLVVRGSSCDRCLAKAAQYEKAYWLSCHEVTVDINGTFLLFFEDSFASLMNFTLNQFTHAVSSAMHRTPSKHRHKETHRAVLDLRRPMSLAYLHIDAVSSYVTAQATVKGVYLSCHNAPISFPPLDVNPPMPNDRRTAHKRYLSNFTMRTLTKLLARHFARVALIRAASVIGSADLLLNPHGLVSSVISGGGQQWRPQHDQRSRLRSLALQTAVNVVHFAESVGRNAEQLADIRDDVASATTRRAVRRRVSTHDAEGDKHQDTDSEELSLVKYDAITPATGLAAGLSAFGISLLAAVGGLANEPIRAVVESEGSGPFDALQSLAMGTSSAIVGAVLAPVAGFADAVALCGRGVLGGSIDRDMPLSCQPLSLSLTDTNTVKKSSNLMRELCMKSGLPLEDVMFVSKAQLLDDKGAKDVIMCLEENWLHLFDCDSNLIESDCIADRFPRLSSLELTYCTFQVASRDSATTTVLVSRRLQEPVDTPEDDDTAATNRLCFYLRQQAASVCLTGGHSPELETSAVKLVLRFDSTSAPNACHFLSLAANSGH